jgi:hypothetical protein
MKNTKRNHHTVLICFGTRSENVEPETKPNYLTSYKDCINKSLINNVRYIIHILIIFR